MHADLWGLDRGAPGSPGAPAGEASSLEEGAPLASEPCPIRCAACGAAVTDRRHAIEVSGSHEHTFVNPAGIIYRVRCFSVAPGCREAGTPTAEWSWFAGCAWSYAFCACCAEHLGWIYRFDRGASFAGLVADRLAEGDGD